MDLPVGDLICQPGFAEMTYHHWKRTLTLGTHKDRFWRQSHSDGLIAKFTHTEWYRKSGSCLASQGESIFATVTVGRGPGHWHHVLLILMITGLFNSMDRQVLATLIRAIGTELFPQ
jgi:hypothetical protein